MSLFHRVQQFLWRTPSPAPESWSIGNPDERHPYEVMPGHLAAKYLEGMSFCATLQVRTPLRILKRHGKVLPLGVELPNDFEPWMGIWVPKSRLWTNLGIEADKIPELVVASPAGPVKPSEYLPFLFAVREAVEDPTGGIEGRLARLKAVSSRAEFSHFVAAEGGAAALCDRLFPPFLSSVPGLPSSSRAVLKQLGLSTPAALGAAPDHVLLAVTRIGPAKLQAIRARCAEHHSDPTGERMIALAS